MFLSKNENEILNLLNGTKYTICNYSKNEIIALENSPCERIGLILEGCIDVKRILTSNSIIHLSSFTKGNLFGEIIAFSNVNKYPATVISNTNSKILFIKKNDFINFCTTHPDFLEIFLNDLTNKILKLNNSITNLSLTSIRQKISNYLISEFKVQGNNFIKLNMTKQKLSEVLGVPRPSLSRELMNMKDLGLIDYSKDFIKIIDLDGLESILMN